MEYLYLVKVLIIVFSAALLQSIVGFGYALLAAPLLTYLMAPKDMVIYLLISGVYLRLFMLYRIRDDVVLKDIKYLFVGAILGIIPGVFTLKMINPAMFKIFIGVVLLISVTLMKANLKWKSKNLAIDGTFFGFLFGYFTASTSVGGPAIVMYMLNTYTDKIKIRNTMILFFTVGPISILLAMLVAGTLHPRAFLGLPVYSVPVVMLAAHIGEKIFNRINQSVFRKLVLFLILISSLAMLYGGYNSL